MNLHTFQINGTHNAIFTSLDPTGFRLDRDLSRMAIVAQGTRLLQVFFLIVMTHIDHDGVEWQIISHPLDLLIVLDVVEMD